MYSIAFFAKGRCLVAVSSGGIAARAFAATGSASKATARRRCIVIVVEEAELQVQKSAARGWAALLTYARSE